LISHLSVTSYVE